MSSNKSTETFANDSDIKNDTNNKTPLSHYIIHDAFAILVADHASLTHTHNTLCANYRALERELHWYADALVALNADCQRLEADYEQLHAAHRTLEAERDSALDEDARMGLKAKRGPVGGRLWGREKMGEVWRMQGEFVWVKVEERGWVRKAKAGLEGVKGCGKKVKRCLGEARERCRAMVEARRGRSVVPVMLRTDLSLSSCG